MSVFYQNHQMFKKGITYNFQYNTPINVGFNIKIAKKYKFILSSDEGKLIYELGDRLGLKFLDNSYIFNLGNGNVKMVSATNIYVMSMFPFKYSEVLAISYRKHLTRTIRRILKYKLTNIDFLVKYIEYRVQKDLNLYFPHLRDGYGYGH